MSSWRVLLPAPLAERAVDAAEAIAGELQPFRPGRGGRHELSLAHGRTGAALFLAYLERCLPGRGYGERAASLLDEAIDGLAGAEVPPGLYHGLAGVGWTLEHLRDWLIDDEDDAAGGEAAVAISGWLDDTPWEGRFDLLEGLAGLAVYARERLPRAGAADCLGKVLDRLAGTACRCDGKAAWKTRLESGEEHFNLGMAHGAPGVVASLAGILAAGLDCRPLLSAAVAWLPRQELPPDSPSVFPYSVTAGAAPIPARLAWCYGDVGVAVALLQAGLAAGEPSWAAEALALARRAALRREVPEVRDATLCHGAAGLAHLFNRLSQATGDPLLAEAALHWAGRALEMRRPGGGVAGFRTWKSGPQGETEWRDDPGFLTGAAGIGLALLAAATPVEPEWDRVLLASLPVLRNTAGETREDPGRRSES